MFSCEYCKIYKNAYFEKHLRTTASAFEHQMTKNIKCKPMCCIACGCVIQKECYFVCLHSFTINFEKFDQSQGNPDDIYLFKVHNRNSKTICKVKSVQS